MLRRSMQVKDRMSKLQQEEEIRKDKGKQMLSYENLNKIAKNKDQKLSMNHQSSATNGIDKPEFNKLNILGNLKNKKLTRTKSSGGVSIRPAIVSACGGTLMT